ncbi:unnamed protein product [Polarella glacialis]|uniref:RING-type E3 ubiquitin transferase n=1 Tax=Polarella glacialis TaxID=89957 RepID=A0A813EIL0_POLGL|nr:unnamed protein product [Polarella glacialis]
MAPKRRSGTPGPSIRPSGVRSDRAQDDGATRASSDEDVEEPESLQCPITYQLFRDPVMNAAGNTYEREALNSAWRASGECSDPLTGQSLADSNLIPNWDVRRRVQAFLEAHPNHTPEGWTDRTVPAAAQPVRMAEEEMSSHILNFTFVLFTLLLVDFLPVSIRQSLSVDAYLSVRPFACAALTSLTVHYLMYRFEWNVENGGFREFIHDFACILSILLMILNLLDGCFGDLLGLEACAEAVWLGVTIVMFNLDWDENEGGKAFLFRLWVSSGVCLTSLSIVTVLLPGLANLLVVGAIISFSTAVSLPADDVTAGPMYVAGTLALTAAAIWGTLGAITCFFPEFLTHMLSLGGLCLLALGIAACHQVVAVAA